MAFMGSNKGGEHGIISLRKYRGGTENPSVTSIGSVYAYNAGTAKTLTKAISAASYKLITVTTQGSNSTTFTGTAPTNLGGAISTDKEPKTRIYKINGDCTIKYTGKSSAAYQCCKVYGITW